MRMIVKVWEVWSCGLVEELFLDTDPVGFKFITVAFYIIVVLGKG